MTGASDHHLAQLNVARMRAPLDNPRMAGFVARLEAVNALADAAPGFVWRLQTDDGDATAIRAFRDPAMLVNLSVWASVEALHRFVYEGDHLAVLKAKRQWFERAVEAHMVLWWIPAGHPPTLEEAKARLEALRRDGPTAHAFTFAQRFPAPRTAAPGDAQPRKSTSNAL